MIVGAAIVTGVGIAVAIGVGIEKDFDSDPDSDIGPDAQTERSLLVLMPSGLITAHEGSLDF